MSCSTLMIFKDGQVLEEVEYRNSHGTAPYVWGILFDKYLKDSTIPYDSWLSRCARGDTELWGLARRSDLPEFERAVHAFTFDRAFVRKQDVPRFAAHIREFLAAYPPGPIVSHWNAIAEAIEDRDCDAVGLYCTSLSDSPWYTYDEDTAEEQLVDINSDECFDIYKLLAGEYDE